MEAGTGTDACYRCAGASPVPYRELSRFRFNELPPPRLQAPYAATFKLTFSRDREKDIPQSVRQTQPEEAHRAYTGCSVR